MSTKHKLFDGIEYKLQHYNGKSVNNAQFIFYNEDGETAYSFTGFLHIYLEIYDEREGLRLKLFTDSDGSGSLSRSTNTVTWNSNETSMLFNDRGKYYYHIYYITTGGYTIPLVYGEFEVI